MIERISHIGIVVEDAARAERFWSERFGLRKFKEIGRASCRERV